MENEKLKRHKADQWLPLDLRGGADSERGGRKHFGVTELLNVLTITSLYGVVKYAELNTIKREFYFI